MAVGALLGLGLLAFSVNAEALARSSADETGPLPVPRMISTSLDSAERELLGGSSNAPRWIRLSLEADSSVAAPRPIRASFEDACWPAIARIIRTTLD